MAREYKGQSAPRTDGGSKGEHGGNRAGERRDDAEKSKRSSQAVGKDPHRGEQEK